MTGIERPVKALVVDDAAFTRRALVDMLSQDAAIEVVGAARHGQEALDAIDLLNPDVITMDVDMPVMDGLTAIKHIMVRRPRPVVMISGLADQGMVTLEALRLGAVCFFPKPSGAMSPGIQEEATLLHQVIKQAAGINPAAIRRVRLVHRGESEPAHGSEVLGAVIVGAHRGSCGSLMRLLAKVSPRLPVGLVVIQELPFEVLTSYASQLASVVPWRLRVAVDGPLEKGCCYLSTSDDPWRLEESGGVLHVRRRSGAEPDRSTDRLLGDAAELIGSRALGVLLGGTTSDGVQGLLQIRQAGGRALILTPEVCVYRQTSEAALAVRAADEEVSEHDLWGRIEAFGRQLWLAAARGRK